MKKNEMTQEIIDMFQDYNCKVVFSRTDSKKKIELGADTFLELFPYFVTMAENRMIYGKPPQER